MVCCGHGVVFTKIFRLKYVFIPCSSELLLNQTILWILNEISIQFHEVLYLWEITPFNPLNVNPHFGRICRFHLQVRRISLLPASWRFLSWLIRPWWWRRYFLPKRWLTSADYMALYPSTTAVSSLNPPYSRNLIHTQNYWVFGLSPSSGILKNRKHKVLETGSVSVLMWGGATYSVGSLRKS
jgi:hypothetical protein